METILFTNFLLFNENDKLTNIFGSNSLEDITAGAFSPLAENKTYPLCGHFMVHPLPMWQSIYYCFRFVIQLVGSFAQLSCCSLHGNNF
jgi:hypothetical protein